MKNYGLDTVTRPQQVDERNAPEGQDFLITKTGRLKTRPGISKYTDVVSASMIMSFFNTKSDDCKNDYRIAVTHDGRIIEDPASQINIPQKEFIVAYWKMDDAQTLVDIPQKANIVAYWKMEDSA